MTSKKNNKKISNGVNQFIATILIIAMVLSIGFSVFLYKPKRADAVLGVEDTVHDIMVEIKEWILDALPKTVARYASVRLQQEIIRWAQGGFTDENKPFAMTSWKQEITEALNIASGRFIQEFGLTPLCAPIRVSLNTMLGLGLRPYGRVPYTMYAACTIGDILGERGTVTQFFENPSIGLYGWDTWTALAQPQNNIYGSFLMAMQRQAEIETEEKEEKEMQKDTGQGYKPEQECINEQSMTDEEMEECRNDCLAQGGTNEEWSACISQCDAGNTGICLEYRTKNLGSTIHSAVEKTIGSDIDWLISADEITEMFALIFSGLFNKLIHGTGSATKPSYRAQTTVSKYQAQYGYYTSYKKAQTPEDKKNLRRDILNNILRAIKNVTTNSYECDKDLQLKGDVFQEVAADIMDEEAQHLYVGMEGVDLKPDFVVLDPSSAPFKTYGTTWDEIPFSRYPSKCEKIAGIRCNNIVTNLPYELNLNNIPECTAGCLQRINEYRTEEFTDSEAISKAVADAKCLSYAAGLTCLNGAKLIDNTKNRCDECVEKAQRQCESKIDPIEKESCVELYCSNYEDIGPTILDAEDFYNRCKTVSLRNSCYVCLKEYFMPAQYCEVIYDFINRSFVKYPAQVYEDMWWGGFNDFRPDIADCPGNTTSNQTIPVGLTCRILPDFKFPGGGGDCKTRCNVTEAELKNISDDKPNDLDCGAGAQWRAGAFHPGGQYTAYLARKRAKCCPALTGHVPDLYKICRGISADISEVELPEMEAQCPLTARTCSNKGVSWTWTEEEVKDIGGVSNALITWKNNFFNALSEPGAGVSKEKLKNAEIISMKPNKSGANIYVARPYCFKPQDCCVGKPLKGSNFSYNNCDSIKAQCKYTQTEINNGYTNEEAKIPSGKTAGDLKPMWVPDPAFTVGKTGMEWSVYGYCSINPNNLTDNSSFIGPSSDYAWYEGKNIICKWKDTNQSETCTGKISESCGGLSGFKSEFWTIVQGESGGIGVCVPK